MIIYLRNFGKVNKNVDVDNSFEESDMIECACGCGMLIPKFDKRGRMRKYAIYHSRRGAIHSDETKLKQRNVKLGKKASEETKIKISKIHKGKKLSEEHKIKIGNASRGRKASEEAKRRMSESSTGKIASAETRKKMSEIRKGSKRSNETKKRMSEALKGKYTGKKHWNYGKKLSKEQCKKISERNKDKNFSEEHKRKLSESHRGEKSVLWKGGISFLPYCPKFNKVFKEKIREKFNRECFLCSKSEKDNGKKLSVHHVQYNKNCGCDDTLKCDYVPLCISCHSKTNNKREYWEKKIILMLNNN